MQPSRKIILGVLVLLTSATLWTLREGSASTDAWSGVEIDWDQFPVVFAESAYAELTAHSRLVLVFSPKDCYSWEAPGTGMA